MLPPSLLRSRFSPLLFGALVFGALFITACASPVTDRADPVSGLADPVSGVAPSTPSPSTPLTELNVFAASSLAAPFTELGELFQSSHPDVRLVFNFAGSQQLARQIIQGAPADVFASADQPQMDAVAAAGYLSPASQQIFARNQLVLIFPLENPAAIAVLPDLAKPGLRLVLAAPEVPVGQYALQFLAQASAAPAFPLAFKDSVLNNVVSYEDNVKAVLAKVALGEADAGIVYASDTSGPDGDQVRRLEIPPALNVVAAYPIAPLNAAAPLFGAAHPALAQAFIELVLSQPGQSILAQNGFLPAP